MNPNHKHKKIHKQLATYFKINTDLFLLDIINYTGSVLW